jgi:RNA polymerase-binding transcription factor DksA
MPAAPAKSRTDLDLDHYRRVLGEERTRIQADLNDVDDREETGGESAELGDLSDYDQHPADQATELFMREQDEAIHASLKQQLIQVEAATRKLEEGTYGLCDRCGAEIPAERLDALPYALYCMPCSDDIGNQY